jgi:hypothetical protein
MGGALVAAPMMFQMPVGAAAAASIAAGVTVAGVASEGFGALTVAAGALAALTFHGLAGDGATAAGAAFVALALAPRSMRGRTARWRVAHGAVSALAGACAAHVAFTYGGEGSVAVRAAALVVAGLVASVTLLLPADDGIAYALSSQARATPGAAGEHLLRAVSLRRRIEGSPSLEALDEPTAARLEQAWKALADIAAQRVAMASPCSTGASSSTSRRSSASPGPSTSASRAPRGSPTAASRPRASTARPSRPRCARSSR